MQLHLYAICAADIMGYILLMLVFVCLRTRLANHTLKNRIFTYSTLLCAVACLGDLAVWSIDGNPSVPVRAIALALDTVIYILFLAVVVLWNAFLCAHLYRNDQATIIRKTLPVLIPAGTVCILTLLNLRFSFLFSIDGQGWFHYGPVFPLYHLVAAYGLAYSIVVYHRFLKENGHLEFFPVSVFLFPIILGYLVHIIVPGLSVGWAGTAIGIAGIALCLQNELSFTDDLTGLYNRTYLDCLEDLLVKKGKRTRIGGLMVDVNMFKNINDSFGHVAGDSALVDLANIFRSTMKVGTIVIRYAGDEFILLTANASKEELERQIEAIGRGVEQFNASNSRPYMLSLSYGMGLYETGMSMDQFIKKLDASMYGFKKAFYQAHPELSRRQSDLPVCE